VTESGLKKPELWFPLGVLVCTQCWLVQARDHASADQIFTDDYPYFSSHSKSWLEQIAANDENLLHFLAARRTTFLRPGSRISVVHEERIRQERPGYILMLPGNICSEVMRANSARPPVGSVDCVEIR